ncbi:CCM (Cerebral Cavernous Malformation) gene homolog [Caenorhabditis elegans]|uniref:CCM (Cerebral Cavernous Malformation) gene homolog n=1 Tax=Caenorhabditis elegans TaxID=6239 RepID=Q9TXI9_CAEEL|nr:CCM (Cerebral Cavernous Malformation) gene homolog [Caenorhabditis elegans]CCD71867.2 CCM (Cerebral Cavernous Malformation) gene homolog [Caenorhabditis elegans]|eukprot:NP_500140.3 CCM (Cerebral Cavernous Malformation) gene homolog [Caenorhabditis elegans]
MDASTSEFATDFIGIISNEKFSGLDDFGRTDFLRIYDKAKKNKSIKSITRHDVNFRAYILQVLHGKIVVVDRKLKTCCFEVSIPLIFSCGSLTEDGLVLFTFNIAPYQGNINYRDLMVLALPDEKTAEKLSEELNFNFARFAEQQLQTASRQSKSLSSLEASSPLANLDTPLTESSHQSSSVVSKAINEVLSCLRPEEVPHFREIIKKYNSGEQNVKIFAQKLVELLGPGRKKRLSYLKHALRAGDMLQFDSAIL